MNEEKTAELRYPEDLQEAMNALAFMPEPARPAIVSAFFFMMTFGIF